MAKKGKKSTASHLDVRSLKDIPALESLLTKGPMAVVLVYADWCGHCTEFKKNVWNDNTLSKTKNLNTASIHYDMMDKTSLKNTPVQGYPSVFMVGQDKKAKEIPTPSTPDDLVKLDNTSGKVLNENNMNVNTNNLNRNNGNGNGNGNNNMNVNNNNNNANVNNNNGNINMKNNNNNNVNNQKTNNNEDDKSYKPAPPNTLDDVVSASKTSSANQMGGNLMSFLNSYIQQNGAPQEGGRSRRRKTRRSRNRRSQTRRK